MTCRKDSSYRRALLVNGGVLVVAAALLAGTPATVSFPITVAELVVVAFGVGVMVGLNAALLRWVIVSDDRNVQTAVTDSPADSDASVREPAEEHGELEWIRARGRRERVNAMLRSCHGFLVDTADGPLGVVDDVESDADGNAVAIVVLDGWFGRRVYRVSAESVIAVFPSVRRLIVDAARVQET